VHDLFSFKGLVMAFFSNIPISPNASLSANGPPQGFTPSPQGPAAALSAPGVHPLVAHAHNLLQQLAATNPQQHQMIMQMLRDALDRHEGVHGIAADEFPRAGASTSGVYA
jgi:hypothetical protein